MIVAQIEQVDAGHLKLAIMLAIGLVGLIGAIVGIWAAVKPKSFAIEGQPVEVSKAPLRYNHELMTERFTQVDTHLRTHDSAIQEIWHNMRAEDNATRAQMEKCFKDIERTLGRIEGKLNDRV